jgi:hypothetical protein
MIYRTKLKQAEASDDEENGLTRKELRISKIKSDFLEKRFQEHNTFNLVSHHILKNIK